MPMTAFSVRAMIGSCDCCSTKRTNKVTSLVAAVVVGITCYIAAAFFAFVLSTSIHLVDNRRPLERRRSEDSLERE